MKNFVLCVIISLMAFSVSARDYRQAFGHCTFWGTEQDMFNDDQSLPFTFDLEYVLSYDANTGEFLATRSLLVPEVNATTPVSISDIQDVAKGVTFDLDANGKVVAVLNFDRDRLSTILLYMGAYRVAYHGHAFPAITGYYRIGKKHRAQSHLDPNSDSGLSYHLEWKCKISNSTNPGQRPTRRRNRRTRN